MRRSISAALSRSGRAGVPAQAASPRTRAVRMHGGTGTIRGSRFIMSPSLIHVNEARLALLLDGWLGGWNGSLGRGLRGVCFWWRRGLSGLGRRRGWRKRLLGCGWGRGTGDYFTLRRDSIDVPPVEHTSPGTAASIESFIQHHGEELWRGSGEDGHIQSLLRTGASREEAGIRVFS